jgi:hypothetical protein
MVGYVAPTGTVGQQLCFAQHLSDMSDSPLYYSESVENNFHISMKIILKKSETSLSENAASNRIGTGEIHIFLPDSKLCIRPRWSDTLHQPERLGNSCALHNTCLTCQTLLLAAGNSKIAIW